ncbi:hypothetical protein B0H11DRAFT_2263140 [Mycena galericulata]|nr:hypothetical protein B0H11DRAFT_2263140 [Mycena galericulata]
MIARQQPYKHVPDRKLNKKVVQMRNVATRIPDLRGALTRSTTLSLVQALEDACQAPLTMLLIRNANTLKGQSSEDDWTKWYPRASSGTGCGARAEFRALPASDGPGRVELDVPLMQVRLLSPGVAIRFHDTEPVFSLRVYGVPNRCCSSSPFSGYPVGDDVDDTLAGAALEESMSLPSGLVLNGRALALYTPRAHRLVDASTPYTYYLYTHTYLQPRATRKTLRRIGTADARILRFFKPPPPSNSSAAGGDTAARHHPGGPRRARRDCATPCTANPFPLHLPASLEHPASLLVEVSTGASPPSLAIISPILRALPFPIVHNLADSPYSSPSNSSFEPDLQGLARQHLPRPPHPSTRTTRATNTAPRRCPRLPVCSPGRR